MKKCMLKIKLKKEGKTTLILIKENTEENKMKKAIIPNKLESL